MLRDNPGYCRLSFFLPRQVRGGGLEVTPFSEQ
jgi:hypothetical protein